jgi:hypothetical protein
MKKLFIFLIILFLFTSSYALAAPNNQGPNNEANSSPKNLTNSSNNNVTPTQNANQLNVQEQISNKGNTSNIQVQQQTQIIQNEGNVSKIPSTVQNQNQIGSNTEQQVRSVIQQKTQEVNSSMGKSLQNQKMAQVAVQTMEATASMFGKSEENISKISNEIKNSFEVTTRAEERIRSKSGFVKFFTGGDNEAAGLITQEIVRNENRIRELNRLIEESDFDPQTKAILQEQVQNIEQEQLRLKTLAEQEINNKGILSWLWK